MVLYLLFAVFIREEKKPFLINIGSSSISAYVPDNEHKDWIIGVRNPYARVLTLYELFIVSSLPVDWNVPAWAKESLIRHVIGEGIPPKLSQCLIHELMIQLNK